MLLFYQTLASWTAWILAASFSEILCAFQLYLIVQYQHPNIALLLTLLVGETFVQDHEVGSGTHPSHQQPSLEHTNVVPVVVGKALLAGRGAVVAEHELLGRWRLLCAPFVLWCRDQVVVW